MNFLKRAAWAAMATAALAGGASAQGLGGTGGTGGLGGLGGLGGGGGGLGDLIGSLGGAQGGGGGSTDATGVNSGVPSVNLRPPSVTAQAPQSVATSNILNKYYAAPLFQGRAGTINSEATTLAVVNPGGFGAPLYGTNLGVSTTGAQAAGGNTRAFGTTGFGGTQATAGAGARGAAGRAGVGGAGIAGGGVNAQSQGIAVQGAPRIAYTATVKFNTPAVTPAQMQGELQAILNRTTNLSNSAGIQLTTGPNGAVALRGQVRDEDEARLIEGLMRTTPGVRSVDNGLQFPKQ